VGGDAALAGARVLRSLAGTCFGKPDSTRGREAAEAVSALIFVLQSDAALAFGLIATVNGELAAIAILATDQAKLKNRDFVNGLIRYLAPIPIRV
jgi:hypothetical protein